MEHKILGATGLRLSSIGAAMNADSAATLLSSWSDPPNWCDISANVTRDEWIRLVGLLQGQWTPALLARAGSAGASEASLATGGELAEGHSATPSAPAAAPTDEIHRPGFFLLVRVDARRWDRSMANAVEQVLCRTGQPHIDLLQLAPFDLERIKAGEPFQRLAALRDARRARYFSVAVETLRDARWVIDHTPAHAITLYAPRNEPGWPELFDAANDADTGLIAGPAAADYDLETAARMLTDTPITAFTWPVDVS